MTHHAPVLARDRSKEEEGVVDYAEQDGSADHNTVRAWGGETDHDAKREAALAWDRDAVHVAAQAWDQACARNDDRGRAGAALPQRLRLRSDTAQQQSTQRGQSGTTFS